MKKLIEVLPKYQQIKNHLLELLQSGEYASGGLFLSENMIQREFHVSKHTVLKAIGELVTEGYLYRRQGAGTFVAERDQTNTLTSSKCIAIINYQGDNQRFGSQLISSQVLAGLEQALAGQQFFFTVRNTNGRVEKEIAAIEELSPQVNGIVLITLFHPDEANLAVEELIRRDIPLVSLVTHPAKKYESKIASVCPDDEYGGYLAGKHLLERGCDFPLVLYPEEGKFHLVNYVKRLKGFKRACREAGVFFTDRNILKVEVLDEEYLFENAGFKAGPQIAEIARKQGRIGLFALMSDALGFGFQSFAADNGIAIPDEVMICGFDNENRSDKWGNALTSIESNMQETGYRGGLLLLRQMNSGKLGEVGCSLSPVTLIKRKSS